MTYARKRDWTRAVTEFERAIAKQPPRDLHVVHQLACLYFLAGQRDKCREKGEAFLVGDHFSVYLGSRILCLDPKPSTKPERLADFAATLVNSPRHEPFLLYAGGLAYYRAGQLAKAIKPLEDAATSSWTGAGLARLVLAMVCQRMGRNDEARTHMLEARDWRQRVQDRPADFSPSDWLEYDALSAEAEKMLSTSRTRR